MDIYQATIQTYNELAQTYQDKFMHAEVYNHTYDRFCQLVEKQAPRILEIGCGPGNVTRYLLRQRPDFRIEGVDLAPKMLELARLNNPEAHFTLLDAREIDQLTGPFDAIMCGFCMPYLSNDDCTKLIKDCADLLATEGLFYFSTMEGEDAKSGYESSSDGKHRVYIHYHQEAYLLELLALNNFELLDFRRQDYPKPDGTVVKDMFFIAQLSK